MLNILRNDVLEYLYQYGCVFSEVYFLVIVKLSMMCVGVDSIVLDEFITLAKSSG